MKSSLLKKIFPLSQVLLLVFLVLPNFAHALQISQIYYVDSPITVNSQLNVYWEGAYEWAQQTNDVWYWEAFSPAPNTSNNYFTPAEMGWGTGWHALAVWDGVSTVYETPPIYVDNPAPFVNGACYMTTESDMFNQQIPFFIDLPTNELCLSGVASNIATSGSVVGAPNALVWNLNEGDYASGWSWHCNGSGGGTTAGCGAGMFPASVSIQWNPTSITSGGSSNLSWTSSDADYCEMGINGVSDFNGDGVSDYSTNTTLLFNYSNLPQGPFTSNQTYGLSCSRYSRWVSQSATLNVTPATYALTVTKAGTGSGTVTGVSSPTQTNINCGTTCGPISYTSGTGVTLTATPAGGSTFTGWSGACTGTGTCVVTMSAAKSVTATFAGDQPSATLTVYTGPYNPATVGAHDITLTVGEENTKVWSSTGGTSWSSSYSYNNGTCTNAGLTGPWTAATADGSVTNIANVNNSGCTATITYTVTGSGGTASDTIHVTTVAAAPLSIVVSPTNYPVTLPNSTVSATYTLTNGTSANTNCRLLDYAGTPLNAYASCGGSMSVTAPAVADTYGYSIQANKSSTGETVTSNSFTVTVSPPGGSASLSCTRTPPDSSLAAPVDITFTADTSDGAVAPYTFNNGLADVQSGSDTTYGPITYSTDDDYSVKVKASNVDYVYCGPGSVFTIGGACGSSPTATITAGPARVRADSPTNIAWTASGVNTSCVITGNGATLQTIASASCSIPAGNINPTINIQTTYCITCDGNTTARECVTVNLLSTFTEF